MNNILVKQDKLNISFVTFKKEAQSVFPYKGVDIKWFPYHGMAHP
jgi:hypothetical protein